MPQTLTFGFDYIQAHVDYFFPQLALYINICTKLTQYSVYQNNSNTNLACNDAKYF